MASSITIRIDIDSESVIGNNSNVSFSGNVPTPFDSGGVSSEVLAQSTDTLPTPFDNPDQDRVIFDAQMPTPFSATVELTDLTEVAPSPDVDMAGMIEQEDEMTQEEEAPATGRKKKK